MQYPSDEYPTISAEANHALLNIDDLKEHDQELILETIDGVRRGTDILCPLCLNVSATQAEWLAHKC